MATENAGSKIRSVPHLVRKEGLAALISLCAVCLLAALWDAPLEGPADTTGMPPEQVKAPWIFVGIQVLLQYLPALIAGILIPLAVIFAIAGIPALGSNALGRRVVENLLFFGLVGSAVFLTVWGYLT